MLFKRTTALHTVRCLLAFGLLTTCLAAMSKAQEDPRLYTARNQAAASTAGGSSPTPGVAPRSTPEADAKVNALIAEVLEPEVKMELLERRSKVIRTKLPVSRVSITDPKTVEVVQFSPTEFELIGLKSGDTNLSFWFTNNQSLRYSVHVAADKGPEAQITREYRELENKVNEMFPNSRIQLIPLADKLILRGQARDSSEASQILAVLSGRGSGQLEGVAGVGAGGLMNLGKAATPNPGGSEIPTHSIINLLDVPGEQQIMLKVRIAKLDRTAAREMSVKMHANGGVVSYNTEAGGLSAAFSSVLTPSDLKLALKAVNTVGYSKILAEPNLVTLNGKPASFSSGGKFAVPTAVGIGGVSGINTQFYQYGTELTFTPTIIDRDRIRLVVEPTSSEIDKDNTVNGIPGVTNRNVRTTVDLRTGQWLAIGGLIEDTQKGTKVKVPFVGDIPIIGMAFSQTTVKRNETELMILVSPELVHPMDAREAPLVLPGMEIGEPGDVAYYIGGAIAAQYERVPNCGGVRSCPTQPCPPTAETRVQASREAMARPDFQASEKYYVYGQHGVSK
jgi:pilus assembly protein CpaC